MFRGFICTQDHAPAPRGARELARALRAFCARRARARSHRVSDPHPAPLPPVSNQSRGKGKENAPANNAATGTKRKPMAPTVTTNAPPAAKKPNGGGDASSPMDFDPEYEELIAMKLATKDTKYYFKAQIAVAKDFS